MEIKDLTKGKYKYDVSKWAKNCPEGAIKVFNTEMFEGLYSYFNFIIKNFPIIKLIWMNGNIINF
jgi:hypothetical protein